MKEYERLCIKCEKTFPIEKVLELTDIYDEDILVDDESCEIYLCPGCLDKYLIKIGFKECDECCRLSRDIEPVVTRKGVHTLPNGDPGYPDEHADLCTKCRTKDD